ncbi:MAG: cytochrome c oxidase subunit II [Actinomycetota bacterium]
MRKHPILQMVIVVVVASVIGIAIALGIPWFPATGSHQADNIHTLYDVLLIASVPIAVLVVTVVLFAVWKFRMQPGEEQKDGPPIHGNTRLEVVWTALPTVLIIGLVSYAYVVLRNNEEHKTGAMTVNVTERQFAFEFSYNSGGKNVVSSDLYLAKDQPVVFRLHSLDVIHSFFVPEFSVKLDAVPGITTSLRVTPTRTGNYPAECTELCGAGHALMRAPVHVVTQQAFQSWLASQKANTAPPIGTPPPNTIGTGIPGAGSAPPASSSGSASSGSSSSASSGSASLSPTAQAGKTVFSGASGCGTCHTLAAAGTSGTVGPNLGTAVVPDARKAGQPLKQFIRESIVDPNKFIAQGFPPNVMPQTFGKSLSSTQINDLVDFIASVTK